MKRPWLVLLPILPCLALLWAFSHWNWWGRQICIETGVVKALDIETKKGWLSVPSCRATVKPDWSVEDRPMVDDLVQRINKLALFVQKTGLSEGAEIKLHISSSISGDSIVDLSRSGDQLWLRRVDLEVSGLFERGLVLRWLEVVGPKSPDVFVAELLTDLVIRQIWGLKVFQNPVSKEFWTVDSSWDSKPILSFAQFCKSAGVPLRFLDVCRRAGPKTINTSSELYSLSYKNWTSKRLGEVLESKALDRLQVLKNWIELGTHQTGDLGWVPLVSTNKTEISEAISRLVIAFTSEAPEIVRRQVRDLVDQSLKVDVFVDTTEDAEPSSWTSSSLNVRVQKLPSRTSFFVTQRGAAVWPVRASADESSSELTENPFSVVEFCQGTPWSQLKSNQHLGKRALVIQNCDHKIIDLNIFRDSGTAVFAAKYPEIEFAVINISALKLAGWFKFQRGLDIKRFFHPLTAQNSHGLVEGREPLNIVEWSRGLVGILAGWELALAQIDKSLAGRRDLQGERRQEKQIR